MPATTSANRGSRLLMMASIVVIVAALHFAREVLIPVSLAVMFSFLLAPLVMQLQRWGLGRIPAVIAVVVILVAGFGTLGWVVYAQLGDLAFRLPEYQQNIEEKVTWIRRFTSGGPLEKATRVLESTLEKATTEPSKPSATAPTTSAATRPADTQPAAAAVITSRSTGEQELRPVNPATQPAYPLPVFVTNASPGGTNPFRNLYKSFEPLLDPLGTLGMVAVFVIFMLITREDLRDRIIRLIGQGRINLTTQAMDEAAQRVSRYLVAQCIVNGTYGAAIAGGLWLIGQTAGHGHPSFPNWLLWGLLTGLLRFIPYLGPWIGAAFPIILSLAVYQGMAVPLAVIGMFIVIELISNNAMEPWLYGTSTGVSAVAILVAAVFWTWLWGIVGLLLSTPLTVLIVVMGKYVPQLDFLNVLLGDEPALEPQYRFYQRLLAEDLEEAEELIVEQASREPLIRIYDQVVIPALGLAEADWHRDRLDERKQSIIRRQVRELVEDMTDLPSQAESVGRSATATKVRKQPSAGIVETTQAAGELAPDEEASHYDRPIVCLPARDEADEIVGVMLAQVLDRKGYTTRFVSVEKLASEYVDAVEQHKAEIVFVSALPPAAVTHARYIVKRLRARLPDCKIIVGLWTLCGDIKKARERLSAAGTDLVVCSLEEAVVQLRQIVQPLMVKEQTAIAAGDSPRNG